MPDGRNNRSDALAIWQAAVDAVRPDALVAKAMQDEPAVRSAPRILVVGAGKAGPGMAAGLETALSDRLDRVEGLVNVPEDMTATLKRVRLHAARPQGVNEPTEAGVAGEEAMLRLLASAGPEDVAICLLSGGGSAFLPAPADGITLADKLAVTKLLHRCGATIDEMNCVRKHLSRVKGGRLAEGFRGKRLLSLIISDVVGDPLDVIASGPTAPDPTTFRDAITVLDKFDLRNRVPNAVIAHLEKGVTGLLHETPKNPPGHAVNRIIGSNRLALSAAEREATRLGYRVWNAGSDIAGETRDVAVAQAELALTIREYQQPVSPPACLLSGGETTVTLGDSPGKGGRNQEFVLAAMIHLTASGLNGVTILSGGTDGEDGPTDAAGAIADSATWQASCEQELDMDRAAQSRRVPILGRVGGLIKTGLTGTNVMDVRMVLVRKV